jgi:hypothetical protein
MICLLDDPECAPQNDSKKPDKEPSHAQDGAKISKPRVTKNQEQRHHYPRNHETSDKAMRVTQLLIALPIIA